MAVVVVKQSWVRRVEHGVLRGVSLVFSMAGAYAIRLFFAPLDKVDRFEVVITWLIAFGFGVLGYFVSRGLVHRMMNKEAIWAYAPICLVVELVEIACNYTLAAETVHSAAWLAAVSASQQPLLTTVTYVVLSVIPLVSLLLAVVDMDLERSKSGAAASQVAGVHGVRPQGIPPRTNANTNTNRPQNNGSVPGRTPPVTPKVTDEANKAAQQAKRTNFWSGLTKPRQEQSATNGNGAAPVGSLLHDPEKFVAVQ